jgi:hypothetical protein
MHKITPVIDGVFSAEAIVVIIYFYHLYILYRDRIQFNLIILHYEMNEEVNRPARGTLKLCRQS